MRAQSFNHVHGAKALDIRDMTEAEFATITEFIAGLMVAQAWARGEMSESQDQSPAAAPEAA
jgi:hypothetical protein